MCKRNFTGKPLVIGISTLKITIRARILDVDGIGWAGSHRILPELRMYNLISVGVKQDRILSAILFQFKPFNRYSV